MLNQITLSYILSFLCGDDKKVINLIAYCDEKSIPKDKSVVIIKSNFFQDGVYGTQQSYPSFPLKKWHNIPILFGEDKEIEKDGQIVIYADLVASSFFLLSRYEETLGLLQKDEFGRVKGKDSLPYRAGFIDRPIIDEYRNEITKLLQCKKTVQGFSIIWLTHDIDEPWEHFTLFRAGKRMLRHLIVDHKICLYPLLNALGFPSHDNTFTFKKMFTIDGKLKRQEGLRTNILYFIKSAGRSYPADGYIYIHTIGFKKLLKRIRKAGGKIGYHVSYEAGDNPRLIQNEVEILGKITRSKIYFSRNHYLFSKKPEDYRQLIDAGISDDFTMAYADIAGFRLGTCRPVKWIDPYSTELTCLTLHPLSIMECTLMSTKYMSLNLAEAYEYSKEIIRKTFIHGGELSLLWHNQLLEDDRDESVLYRMVISFISSLSKSIN